MPENELIIRHNGKEYDFELREREADLISDLTSVIEHAPFDQGPTYPAPGYQAPKDEQARRGARRAEYDRLAGDFQAQLKRFAALDDGKMAMVIAFLDVIELGDLDGSQSNWILEFIEDVLRDVIFDGPVKALQQDPRGNFASLAHYVSNYWAWVRDHREAVKLHPELFPAPPAEPEAVPEPAVTPKPAKRQRARKSRKAAS